MSEKTCSVCGLTKDEDEFNWKVKAKGRRNTKCRSCEKEWKKQYVRENKERLYLDAEIRKLRVNEWLINHKSSLECETCGENHPACLEFHHVNPDEKEHEISKMVARGFSMKAILREIEKCKILCANCHHKLHNGWKYEMDSV